MNLAVFASGRGSNFLAIAKAVKSGKVKVNLALLVCDNPKAPVIKKARKLKIRIALVKAQDFGSRKDFEDEIIKHLKDNNIHLIAMAGFMRMLGIDFVRAYKNRIINIHPSLLPSFKGEEGIRDAFLYGAKVTGVTIHFVDEKMDHGPIILQRAIEIKQRDTLASLEKKIHRVEHELYPQAIALIVRKKIRLAGRRVKIKAG